ncbi:hypothetical protein CRYUN_Cryun26dG0112300 [Craigia yunnanensis]
MVDRDPIADGPVHEKWLWGCEAIIQTHRYGNGRYLWGEKCELPRFSGLILYDERGQLLDHSINGSSHQENNIQKKPTAVARTTLRDLLYFSFVN